MNFYDIIFTTKETVTDILKNRDDNYLSYPISKKSGKKRWLDAPRDELKAIQTSILYNFLYKFKAHDCAVGFVSGMGVPDGAERHLGQQAILCMDISNFFNSVKSANLYKLIFHLFNRYKNFEKDFVFDKNDLQNFINLVTHKGQLPQGAPTSPALANLYCMQMDTDIATIAELNNLIYTRYADDLTFSHPDKKHRMGTYISEVTNIVSQYGLKINKKKTRIRKPNQRMSVTGVVINQKLSVPKWKWRNFRAKLHNILKENQKVSLEDYQQMRGYCEWIKSLHPKRGNQFLTQLGKMTLKS